MYQAFLDGRTTKDPAEGWYAGELWFFDQHVIPLAKRLEEMGCFGLAATECVKNALSNREEWVQKGKDIVKQMVAKKMNNADQSSMTEPSSVVEHLTSTSNTPSIAEEQFNDEELRDFVDV